MYHEKCLNLSVLTVTPILFITYSTFNQQKFTQSALETDTVTVQVSKKTKKNKKQPKTLILNI